MAKVKYKKRMNKDRIELLVPAGGMEQFLAAVENGADAIYVGGQLFNARAGAQNFKDEELILALDYAHKRGVKVYVTMNTLLRNDELEPALRYASFLHDSGVDAIIVQDIGFGELVRRALPELEIHMSTQATITDANSARVAHELGYKRVVVARELALPEIEDICRAGSDGASDFEVEVFVHGAICVCYSGQCQYSRYYGGRSGNRGSCAQPCRLSYASYDEGGRRLAAASHPMSPRDMCLLDQLGGLIDAGAASFKIEGRLKSAEYVAIVTSIYRKYIDIYLEEGYIEVSDEDRDALLQIFNRGEFTNAYLKGESGDSLMSGDIVKNQGLELGRVIATKKGSTLVDIEVTREPAIGDGAEIYGRGDTPLSSTVLSYVKELGDGRYRIGDFRGTISAGDVVRRTSRKSQLEAARQTFKGAAFLDEEDTRKVKRRRKIDMTLQIEGNSLVLKANTVKLQDDARWPSCKQQTVSIDAGPFDYDYESPTPIERYESALAKTGTTPFELNELRIIGDPLIRVKASELNSLRRRCLAELSKALEFRRESHDIEGVISELHELVDRANDIKEGRQTANHRTLQSFELYFSNIDDWRDFEAGGGVYGLKSKIRETACLSYKVLLPMAGILTEVCERQGSGTDTRSYDEVLSPQIVPYIGSVTKGREEEILQENYESVSALALARGIYVSHLGWLSRMIAVGADVIADFGLNAYNHVSISVLKRLGVRDVRWSLELASRSEGNYPLMQTEHRFPMARLKGKREHDVRIVNNEFSSQSLVLPCGDDTEIAERVVKCLQDGRFRLYV
nr:U32 family peptidase [uncultured Mogibacterium sp.]